MPNNTEIANLAISHLGIGKEIGNLETERSEEAATLRRFFTACREATLRDFPWPFASQIQTLALVSDPPSETDEWLYAYRYPTNCLMFRRIQSGLRIDTQESRVVYKLGRDAVGQLIYTDKEDAVAEFTYREEDPSRFPPDFVMAFSLRLAAYSSPRLTGGDPFKLGLRCAQLYLQEISMAQATASNESVPDRLPDAEAIRAREGVVILPNLE